MMLVAAAVAAARSAGAEPNVTMTAVRELGLVAEIHSPVASGTHPGILVIGGSEGGLEWARATADELAMHGHVAMALAYFRATGLPAEVQNIPVE
jgi:dienelactone hydrolase